VLVWRSGGGRGGLSRPPRFYVQQRAMEKGARSVA
jgi:hypothetical protein